MRIRKPLQKPTFINALDYYQIFDNELFFGY